MKTKYYHYFISYCYTDVDQNVRLGMADITSLNKIKSFDDILNVIYTQLRENMVSQKISYNSDIIILNYQLICDEPY